MVVWVKETLGVGPWGRYVVGYMGCLLQVGFILFHCLQIFLEWALLHSWACQIPYSSQADVHRGDGY
jgi:hypothetical protein